MTYRSSRHEPAIFRSQLHTDPAGYFVTVPGTTPETFVTDVFAAGDVQDKRYG